MKRYNHNIDYKLSVPSNVPIFTINDGDIEDELVSANEVTYNWLKALIKTSDFEEGFKYDLNSTIDTQETTENYHEGFSGWDTYNEPYHLFYYWNVEIESHLDELKKEEVVAYYKKLIEKFSSPDEIEQHLTLEYYKDKNGLY